MLVNQSSWADFVNTQPPEAIAKRIRLDEELVDAGSPCSFTAYHLPKSSTPHALAIANHLVPARQLSRETKALVYDGLVSKIKAHLLLGPSPARVRPNGTWLLNDGITWEPPARPQEQEKNGQDLSPEDLTTTLRVLHRLTQTATLHPSTPLSTAITTLQQRLPPSTPTTPPPATAKQTTPTTTKPSPPPSSHPLCYICRLTLTTSHPLYSCLCPPCGSFNLAQATLSLPPNLHLPSRTALVTGARLNLGFATALRLLRCGARVIASSRYPRDAAARYAAEPDCADWWPRLVVVGADFRCAADAFGLVAVVRRVLAGARLDVLVNNAAQTLTDGVEGEGRAVQREEELRAVGDGGGVVVEGAYRARVRGGATGLLDGGATGLLDSGAEQGRVSGVETAAVEKATRAEVRAHGKSSWVQSLFEIPYEDVISAHAVNAFVPLILCRELLPLMGRTAASAAGGADVGVRPLGYVVNVSSREGVFESRPGHSAKRGRHVHTNMSKAALNMLTETEAAAAWRSRRVAMNTVDPGYMSAAPEYEDAYGGVRPIGWEDGAGRVLWPVAMGEGEKAVAVWGRFLKHYGMCDVDPRVGRG